MSKSVTVLVIAALWSMDAVVASSVAAATLRRFVVIAGSNYGGNDRVPLRYAVTDGENFAKVLEEMGGVESADRTLLREPSVEDLHRALGDVRQRVASASELSGRTEVVLYYSGHADEKGLLLGHERLAYQKLRREMETIPADVHITVLDACASGAITRLKGGQRHEAFLLDDSMDMEGYAFITSSSEDEAAQESDRISGSFFTHYLVSGMRGAADVSGDGRVTLSEAYQFAFNETLTRTAGTKGGAQHPAYEINLTGTGDVVMTDVREISAGMILAEGLHGRFFIRNDNEQLVAELFKPAGRTVELGLEPGSYVLHLQRLEQLRSSELVLADGQRLTVDEGDFHDVEREQTALRGGAQPAGGRDGLAIELDDQYEFFDGEDDYTLSISVFLNKKRMSFKGLQAAFFVTSSEGNTSSQVAGLANLAEGNVAGVQLSPFMNYTEGDVGKAQWSGLVNYSRGSVGFGQLAPLGNFVGGDSTNVQLAGAVNFTRGDIGFGQFGSLNYTRGRVEKAQVGVANFVEGPVGFGQLGVVNYAGAAGPQIQIAGFGNFARGNVGFGQFSGGLNYAGTDVEKVQIGGFLNFAEESVGLGQLSGGANFIGGSGPTNFQLAGFANFARGDVAYGQGSFGLNFAEGDVSHAQLAGFGNVALGRVKGLQVAPLANYAGGMRGLQGSAGVNVAQKVEGLQVGAANLARTVDGAQIGLINISETINGPSIGLFTYSKNGLFNFNVWGDETGTNYLTATTGSRSVFTSISAGFTPMKTERSFSLGLGSGLHFDMDRTFFEVDANNHVVVDEFGSGRNVNNLTRVRALGAFEAVPEIHFFGGFSYNLLWLNDDEQVIRPVGHYDVKSGDQYRTWVGFFAGVRLGR